MAAKRKQSAQKMLKELHARAIATDATGKSEDSPPKDFTVGLRGGRFILVFPESPRAREWLAAYLPEGPKHLYFGDALAVSSYENLDNLLAWVTENRLTVRRTGNPDCPLLEEEIWPDFMLEDVAGRYVLVFPETQKATDWLAAHYPEGPLHHYYNGALGIKRRYVRRLMARARANGFGF